MSVARLKTTDIPSSVSKMAPDFCTVYVISKTKISSVRNSSRGAPYVSPVIAHLQKLDEHANNGGDASPADASHKSKPSTGRSIAFFDHTVTVGLCHKFWSVLQNIRNFHRTIFFLLSVEQMEREHHHQRLQWMTQNCSSKFPYNERFHLI